MTAALVGLAGVVVGAMLQGVVATFLARREVGRRTRAAARILSESFSRTANLLRTTEMAGTFTPAWDQPHKMEAWLETRSILAEQLSFDDWAKVRSAIAIVTSLVEAQVPGSHQDRPLDEMDRALLSTAQEAIADACRALDRLSVTAADANAYLQSLAREDEAAAWLREHWNDPIED